MIRESRRGDHPDRRGFLARAAALVAGMEVAMVRSATGIVPAAAGPLDALGRATAWLNSPPLTADRLRGKVVLVEFLTYTCINWLRTMPYVRAWADRYRADGLVVLGIHTPEFSFEKDLDHVRRGMSELGVTFPVAVDSDYAIWRAFDNNYWPALYFIDADGVIRDSHFGEGRYEEAERMIRRLLEKAGARKQGGDLVRADGRGVEAAADWDSLGSPETYLGTDRGERRAALPSRLGLNEWALAGSWSVGKEAVVAKAADARLSFRFRARDLHLVMGPPSGAGPVRFRVTIDGQPPGAARGGDVDERGNGTANFRRMYQLVRQPRPVRERLFEITFLDPGVEAFAFTFG